MRTFASTFIAIVLSVVFCGRLAFGTERADLAKKSVSLDFNMFDGFAKAFKFTADQQSKWDEAKKSLSDKVAADPDLADDDHRLKLMVRKAFREVLTDEQQSDLDTVMTDLDSKTVLEAAPAKLKKVMGGLEVYANYHDGAWAPDLVSTLGKGQDAAEDLVVWPLPFKLSVKGAPDQAKWVKDHCDLVYFRPDGKVKDKPADKVIVYVKPELLSGNAFLMGDGNVVSVTDKDKAAKIVKELEHGHNPPPSLPMK